MPLPNLTQPDLPPSADEIVAPGYLKYPANLITSVAEPPGKGGDVNALTYSLSTPPTPVDQNPAWQSVNKALGVNLKVPIVGTADYANRLSTVLAGSDLPDIIAVSISVYTVANLADFLQAACADLTPFLFARWAVLEQAGITQIKSVDQFTAVCKQLNNPGTRWSLGATGLLPWLVQVFGGPNQWRESGGTFTRDLETPEYREAVAYHRQLWDTGLFHPDSATLSGSPAGQQFYAGKFIFSAYANWSSYDTAWTRTVTADPTANPRAVVPFSPDPNKRAPQFLGHSTSGSPTASTKSSLGVSRSARWIVW